ncbi:MAG: methylenetetrahydrofolate--tRNA-(uracil(54)-C(5))-methyltransferase (FADH(2)-oxidizing) TrmFO [Oscillospiraceae bacterium]|nr:methylenetetrahydrofolate--tRNA-(uracil(54)-C(5))-methyltransferase (FADH(2)-oxidizing) TrmFO [Candidatus Limimonas coprohippi]
MAKAIVIGAGFAGVEASVQLARAGVEVHLYEMKPHRFSPAHKNENFAELVCSNSFKALRVDSAAGLMKEEMTRMGSICVPIAKECSVPAGGSLSVNREDFARMVTEKVESFENIFIHREEVTEIPKVGKDADAVVIAAGPLVSDALSKKIEELCGDSLHFFDAAAPIVAGDSIDMEYAFAASRYDHGDDDYINCPMNKEEYEAFYEALVNAEGAPQHDFDKRKTGYEGCMPIEVMANRGIGTMRFGPMKPVGLRDPKTGHRPWACLQLRRETKDGDMFNLVGFQTNLKFGEQKRVFSMIPALHDAEFLRYGVMHRNTFINSPKLLSADYQFRTVPGLFFAGQITGVEGYMESAQSGLMAGLNAARFIKGEEPLVLPKTTIMGALASYISDESVENFQPMGANFGVLPAIEPKIRDKKERYAALSARSLQYFEREE